MSAQSDQTHYYLKATRQTILGPLRATQRRKSRRGNNFSNIYHNEGYVDDSAENTHHVTSFGVDELQNSGSGFQSQDNHEDQSFNHTAM